MSAVVEKESGGELRPKMRHRWLNNKQVELKAIMEESEFNSAEDGEGEIGFVGCGIGYAFSQRGRADLRYKNPDIEAMHIAFAGKKGA